ncbi:MAG: type IV toxin-antitoxin system AbiEi family antitoxin domain-containing protein [Actinomycetota bacterium]|nr:type IV toxin-antitoxin system AbiEi family antitoxin domain-containing protein [Actinomycetota bacterium]
MKERVHQALRAQEGVISRRQALLAGLTSRQIDRMVSAGDWQRLHNGVYRVAGAPVTAHGRLLAACLARPGAVASHESAAWLWDLVPGPPPVPTLSVLRSAGHLRAGVVVRQVADLSQARIVTWRQIPCTNPLRTLVDLAGVTSPRLLDDAIDRALATRLVTVDGLVAEVGRLARQGRRGVGGLRRALERRGLIGGPHPSVLESRLLRLLAQGGIPVAGVEVKVDGADGRYRLDVVLCPGVALEVDGYCYHAGPSVMARDLHRHNDLGLQGWVVLRFTWVDVVGDGERLVAQVRQALQRFA